MSRRRSGLARIDNHQGIVIGSDEVGFGAWAGPLVVCAVAGPVGWDDPRVKDSKLLKPGAREALFKVYSANKAFQVSTVIVSSESIDQQGVGHALRAAHIQALEAAACNLEHTLGVVDGALPVHTWGLGIEVTALPKADQLIPECALASIIAKVTRDRLMADLDLQFPGYDLRSSSGYGTARHKEALDRLGPSPIHRKSYSPVANASDLPEKPQDLFRLWEALDPD